MVAIIVEALVKLLEGNCIWTWQLSLYYLMGKLSPAKARDR